MGPQIETKSIFSLVGIFMEFEEMLGHNQIIKIS
jgi:hypothetical protein